MRIALFDWASGGHHALYARRFAKALAPWADVIVAAPDETLDELADLEVETIALGRGRPPLGRRLGHERYRVVSSEARLLVSVAAQSEADHVVHLYADAVIPALLRRSHSKARISVLLFHPWAHYPRALGSKLSAGERVRALASDALTAAWRRRADANAVLTLDEEAARLWRRSRGAPAHWIPEPPVFTPTPSPPDEVRSGCILYGALGERKGIDLLANAVASERASLRITIAGEADASFLPALDAHARRMRAAGVEVDLRPYRHTEPAGLQALAAARCAVLPYPRHTGMSRILVEACSAGTPVVVHDWGLLGHLVRRHGVGRAVDCRDPNALRAAILELTADGARDPYRAALARFASRYSAESFGRALRAPFFGEELRGASRMVRSRIDAEIAEA